MDNILVLGSGSREHSLIDTILKSNTRYTQIKTIFVYPGNDGILLENNVEKATINDYNESLINFCKKNNIKMVIVGSETLLVDGICDYLQSNGILCLGPDKEGALIEGSKAFSKHFMVDNNIKTADYKTFTSLKEFTTYYEENLKNTTKKYVVKASGLAGGKGVILPNTNQELFDITREMLEDGKFGSASSEIIIEECLEGVEVSIIGFCNGETVELMPQSQDYKKIYDNDEGLNTGGMGSHAPVFILNEEELTSVKNDMIKVVKKLNYRGILYAGIMKTKNGLYFLEFNCRMGDPEAQVLFSLIDTQETDLYSLFKSCMNGNKIDVKWKSCYASNIVLSHNDYPVKKSDKPLEMMIDFPALKKRNVKLYWANLSISNKDEKYYTTGGRVVSMVITHSHFIDSFHILYNSTKFINYKNMYYRRDIGLNSKYLLDYNENNKTNNKTRKIKIGVLGSTNGNSLQYVIDAIKEEKINASIEVIISNKKDAFILTRGQINNINSIYLSSKNISKEEYDVRIINMMRVFNVELIIMVGYMKIVTKKLIDDFRGNIINVHPSLLPKYGGGMDLDVHKIVIDNKEFSTGCTVHHVIEEVDAGNILQQKQLIVSTTNPKQLKLDVQYLEGQSLIEVIQMYINKPLTYKYTGVNIEEGNNLVSNIKNISDNIGGFSALYDIDIDISNNNNNKYKIVIGSATDGVGTKLELAIKMNKFDTIGIDLVAMSVNDLLACGIKPLFFLDYLAIDKINVDKCKQIINGVNEGCKLASCSLIGGETAEMKGIYFKDKFDIAGFGVGIQQYELDPINNIKEGDYIYGIKSHGIHSNGYTLVNKLLEFSYYDLEEVIKPTRIYMETLSLLEKYKSELVGISHITGGGFKDNILRILPNGLSFELKEWELPSIFRWIQDTAKIDKNEMMNTFNCGYGMVYIFNKELSETEKEKYELDLIGRIFAN